MVGQSVGCGEERTASVMGQVMRFARQMMRFTSSPHPTVCAIFHEMGEVHL